MFNKSNILIAIFFFGLGLSVELFRGAKSINPDKDSLDENHQISRYENYDVRFGSNHLPKLPRTALQKQHARKLKSSLERMRPNNTDKPLGHTKMNKDTKKTVAVNKNAAKNKAAKNKKNKKPKKSFSAETAQTDKSKDKEPPKDQGVNAGFYNNTVATTPSPIAAVAGGKQKDPDAETTLEEWEDLLLEKPDLEETERFIQLYRTKEVSDDIFYDIARQMIRDDRNEMKILGLKILDSSPGPNSYQVLTNEYFDRATTADTKVLIQRHLNNYARIESFSTLAQGLSQDQRLEVNLMSLRLIEQSLNRYRTLAVNDGLSTNPPGATGPSPNPTPNPTGGVPGDRNTANTGASENAVLRAFSNILAPVRALTGDQDKNLSLEASSLADRIQQFVG